MEKWQIDGVDRLERAGYLNALRGLVRSHTCPFWWYDNNAALGNAILHNGTVTFINSGKKTIAVTAAHVYEQYLKDKERDPSTKCQFGGMTVEPERYLISKNTTLDIATFELPIVLATATGVTVHNARIWPPEELKASDLIILGGYPGNRRTERSTTADFDFVNFIGRVGQSSEDHVSLHLNIAETHWPQGVALREGPDLGGVSGGPVFRIRTEPLETIEFAGVIYEASQSFELVFARHAFHISDDGFVQ